MEHTKELLHFLNTSPSCYHAAANVAQQLQEAGAKVLCLDCFGYTTHQQKAVAALTGLPTVLPREVLVKDLVKALTAVSPAD
jgi:hypothetical protein